MSQTQVLLVDDDPVYVRLVHESLKSLPGVELLTANSGAQGLTMLNRVDLVIADYSMPGMDGFDFLSLCSRLRPEASRILLTASPGPAPDLELWAKREVNAAFVWKGLGLQALVTAVRKVMLSRTSLAYLDTVGPL